MWSPSLIQTVTRPFHLQLEELCELLQLPLNCLECVEDLASTVQGVRSLPLTFPIPQAIEMQKIVDMVQQPISRRRSTALHACTACSLSRCHDGSLKCYDGAGWGGAGCR